MSPSLILAFVALYFLILLIISYITGKNADTKSFFLANKQAPWYLVAFGMIGDSLSGVTYLSVPGAVGKSNFYYLQVVLGYTLGYIVIAKVLLPLYYRMNLTSIYSYLLERFGKVSQKTGSFFFLLSRTLGAAIRLFLSANVFQVFVFDKFGIPFAVTLTVIIIFMFIYTYQGGIKTLIWTDSLQSLFLVAGVILSIIVIGREMNWGVGEMVGKILNSPYSDVFNWHWQEKQFFFKQFFSGAFIAIVMSGLDQNMMQKNLSCKSLGDAQKNLYWFSGIVVLVNIFFLSLGALLYLYSNAKGIGIPPKTDHLFPLLALNHLGVFASLVFILGLTAATFNSADSVLTTLTTSYCVDFLDMEKENKYSEKQKTWLRHNVQIVFGFILLFLILGFKSFINDAVINAVLTMAGYTYGPLLGLFTFGIFMKQKPKDIYVPVVCVVAPILCFFIDKYSQQIFLGYEFGFELLILNGGLTFLGLWGISGRKEHG